MHPTTIRPADVVRAVAEHPGRVAAPAIVVTLLALVFALVRPATWEAAQALVVRDETGDRLTRPGRFSLTDEMKASQETILELARSRGVLLAALAEVGPPADSQPGTTWPDEKAFEELSDNVKITPPKGAEFGKTEVFYVKVQDGDRQRAIELALAICHQLQKRFSELREAKAQSTTQELSRSAELAQAELNTATQALARMEQRVGSDLAELRILNDSPSGDSDLRRTATELEKELRAYQATQSENEQLLKLLETAKVDPTALVASPSVLIKSQPALGRLKDGLVDAQLRTGQALGTMSEEHPLTKGAREAESAIRHQLHEEIEIAIRGVKVDLQVNAERVHSLEEQNAAIQARLERLATVRADYANLASAVKNRAETLKTVEHNLSEARASLAAAKATSLITLVDRPDAGTRPLGPGRTIIVLAGLGGGIMISLAIVFLTVAPAYVPANTQPQPLVAPVVQPATASLSSLTLKQALQRVAQGQI